MKLATLLSLSLFLLPSTLLADTLYQANVGGYGSTNISSGYGTTNTSGAYTAMNGGYYGTTTGAGAVPYDQFNYPQSTRCCGCNPCNNCGTDYFSRCP